MAGSPVVYVGRFADRISVSDLPEGYVVLGEWDVLPAKLAACLEGATALVLLDVFSFPFEAMTPEQWDVPMIVVLPARYDADFLEAVFGAPLFGRLTFFDRVAAPEDSSALEELRRLYRWAESQHVRVRDESPEEVAAEICGLLEAESTVPRYPDRSKGVHRAQKAVLEPQFEAARGERASDVPFEVLEVGAGLGRWVPSFDPAATRFFGVDAGKGTVAAARADFPEASFDSLGIDLLLPHEDERFDLVFCVDVLRRYPASKKKMLLSEMWRVARPGGRLLFLEEFVSERAEDVYPTSVNEFVGLLLDATSGQVVLEHMESLRYPREDLTRSAVIAVSRLGVPRKW